jgi:hypothetical protein
MATPQQFEAALAGRLPSAVPDRLSGLQQTFVGRVTVLTHVVVRAHRADGMRVLADKDVHPDQSVLRGLAGGHFQAALDLYHVITFSRQDAALRVGIDVEFLERLVLGFHRSASWQETAQTTLRDAVTLRVTSLHSVIGAQGRLLRRYTSVGK